MAKSKGRKKIIVSFLVILAVAGWVAYGKYAHRTPPINISEDKTTRRNITELVVANGKIEPVLEVKISPEVSGEIIQLEVKEGQHVRKGDLLLKIRPDNYLAARDSAQANYKFAIANKNTAQANLDKADLEYKRNDALFKAKLISESDYLTAKTTYDVAKTTVAASLEQMSIAQAQLSSAEADLSKTVIYSPLDGTVSKLNSQLGERVVGTATMAGTEIMDLANLTNMEARVDVGEMDVPLIAVGQNARLEVDSFKDRKFKGVVTEIANSANNNDTSNIATPSTDATKFQVKIHMQEQEEFLPGMSVTAYIETRFRTNVLSVPIQSVTVRLPGGGSNNVSTNALTAATGSSARTNTLGTNGLAKPQEVVFVVNGDHVQMVPVKVGISDDNYIEITEGLKEGQEVVSGGYKAINRDLSDGAKIMLNAAAAGPDREMKPN
jgi:HlyD family secretion protein